MGENEYKIALGVKLDTSDLQTQIDTAGSNIKPIDIKVDAETKELTKTINEALKSLSNGSKNALTLDTSKLEASLSDVTSTIKDIKTAIGSLDSGSGMKSLVGSINSISTALDKASNKFDELIGDLKSLSGKDFSLNFGINVGSNNQIARNAAYGSKVRGETLPQLKQQVNDLVKYYNSVHKSSFNDLEVLSRLVTGTKLNTGDFFTNFLYGADSVASRMGGGSLSSQMQAYKEYIDMFKKAASLRGLDLSSVTSSFSKTADDLIKDAQDIQTGAKEMDESFDKLKQIFSGGSNLNIEELSVQLDPIIKDLKAIREAVEGLSKGASLEGLTQSFDRLSDTLEQLMTNAKLVQDVLGGKMAVVDIDTGEAKEIQEAIEKKKSESRQAQETANDVVQSEERKQQAYRETAGVIENLKTTLETMKLDRSSIDTVTKDIEELGFAVTDASVKMKNHDFDITVKGVDSMGRVITEIRHLDSATGEISGMGRTISQTFKESDVFIKQQKQSVANLTNQIEQMNRAANDQNASKPIKDSSNLNELSIKYNEVVAAIQRMGSASSDAFIDEQNNVKRLISEYKSLVSEFKNAENVATSLRSKDIGTVKDTYSGKLDVLISKMKSSGVYSSGFEKGAENLRSVLSSATDASGLVKFLNGLDKLEAGYKKADAAAKEFNRSKKVGINVSGLESKIVDIQRISPEINQFETEINGAKVTVQSLLNDLKQVNTQGDFSVVNSRFKAFADAAKAAGIAIAETSIKIKSVNDIRVKLADTGFDGFDQELRRAHEEANKLNISSADLQRALSRLDAAMEAINTADEANDVRALVNANKEYDEALNQVYSQLKLNQQAEKDALNIRKLEQSKQAFSLQMSNWLRDNSVAAKQFGDRVKQLQVQLNNCDATQLDGLKREFKTITQEAKLAGKTGQTALDGLKTQFSKYSQYFSVASLFMYAEQGLRSMFEQVKLIDSAMTELKKVTDETDATYNKFLSNAATRSKEIGTTIDGLVSSTADFARLGYGFEDAQGLAEVANIYAVVGDEIEGVEGATESLISTMAAFKDEFSGMSNTDTAMRIIDKFNEIGNNFAISSGGIGEALERSASSLMAANNTIDESIALITAA